MNDRPPSLLWWLPEYPPDPGGIATFAAHLAPALAARGHAVTAFITRGGPEVTVVTDRYTLQREPFREAFESNDPVRVARLGPTTKRIKRDVSPEVYHVHLCEPSPFLHLATLDVAPAPTVLTIHNETIAGFDPDDRESVTTRLFEASSIVTVVSSTAARSLTSMALRFAHRIVPIPNGAPFPTRTDPVPEAPRLVAVGRLHGQKGFDRLLASMVHVVRDVPEVHLDVLGDGPDRGELVALVAELGLTDHVTLHGNVHRSAVDGFLDRARIFVAPSRYEGLPYATLEAAGHGRPVIATNTAGIDEVVVDGLTGVLVDNTIVDEHPEVLADAVVRLVRDHDACVAMGRAGHDRTVRHFSLDSCVDAYEHVYRAATQRRRELAVVIPVHNGERHLAAAIESALGAIAHAGVDAQVIVVDDGSTDASLEIARGYGGRGVDVFSQPNLGSGIARNTGIALTNSEWVAHLDADDLWPVDRLRRLLEAAADAVGTGRRADVVFGNAMKFADPDAPPTARIDDATGAVRMGTTAIVRRSAYDTVGGFGAARTSDHLEWTGRAAESDLDWVEVDALVLERRIHATNQSHGRPFTTDRTRVAILKAHLDRLRDR